VAEQYLYIHEIFSSIQGESTLAGLPCTFVRLSGCALRCDYCDTSYAFTKGDKITLEDIVQTVRELGNPLVEITGGEPLLQKHVFALMSQLCDQEFSVMLETSGDRDISNCDARVYRIVDIKTPNSGASNSFLESNFMHLCSQDEVKFVITNRADFDWAIAIVQEQRLLDVARAVHFSPVMYQESNSMILGCQSLAPQELAQWILKSGVQVRLHLQIHRYVWDPNARGV
jgi:7-carboxy-7-deazaguanine synthase